MTVQRNNVISTTVRQVYQRRLSIGFHFYNFFQFSSTKFGLRRSSWSRGNVLALRSKIRGFKPGLDLWFFFQDVKIRKGT